MICEVCKLEEATIHIDESFDKAFISERHLCKKCALQIDLFNEAELFSFNIENVLNVYDNKFFEKPVSRDNIEHNKHVKCEKCFTTLNDILLYNQVGCPDCYSMFSANIIFYLKSTMKGRRHLGKKPNQDIEAVLKNKKRFELEKELLNLISNEDYENAAIVRDCISILK